MRLAHFSDLHFGSFTLNPLQFFSKRWIGNFNYLLTRKRQFAYGRLIDLINLLKEEEITHVVITGDLTVTARNVEYQMGQRFIELLKKEGMTVLTIPGNHDHYTAQSFRKKSFYNYFPKSFDPQCPLNLKDNCVTYTKIGEKLWIVGLDTAISTPYFSAQGLFSSVVEENLEKAMKAIPQDEMIILINHYPFFYNKVKHHELVRGPALEKLLKKYPHTQLYLHGHTHTQVIADLRESDLPIVSDSGSISLKKGGACHLFDISDNVIKLDVYRYDDGWKASETHEFNR